MKTPKQWVDSVIVKEILQYVEKDPVKNLPKAFDKAGKIVTLAYHKDVLQGFKKITKDPENNWNILIKRIFEETTPHARKQFVNNFLINSNVYGTPKREKLREENNCNIPWAILMDPTSACNLKCTGCWAAEYNKTSSLEIEVLDRIIEEGKELGIYMYIYSGGEPLVRKDDLIKLAEKHDDCYFLSFTNATLVDDKFAKELARVGNFALAISVEGHEKETDMRRGEGTYQKVMEAMDILKKEGVVFGYSTCYHKYNTEDIGSEDYMDLLIDKGCLFGWYFTYIPIGKDAVVDLLATPQQREHMYHRVREMRKTKPVFTMDFWNDGEYVDGCIAGGKNYFHINSNGDIEPCAFIHYSNVNIKDVSLLDALKSPLFQQYRKNQPFNNNHLKPCPLLDNPEKLIEMVHNSNAYSTQPIDEEIVEDLTDKCQDISKKWTPVANKLWEESQKTKAVRKEGKAL